MKKRVLAMILCLAMFVSLFPAAYAENDQNEPSTSKKTLKETVSHADWTDEQIFEEYLRLDALEDDAGIDAFFAVLSPKQQASLAAALAAPVEDAPSEQANIIASGNCGKNGDNVTWTLDENGNLTISGTGEMAAFDYGSSPWYEYRNDVKTAVISEGITSICSYAFSECSSLTSIEIPNSVTYIGNSAFSYCSSLTSVTIPDSVTSIGDEAFYECSSLNEIVVSDTNNNYSSIDGVLYNKDKTELIRYPEEKKGQFVITDGVTSIGNYAFSSCRGLTSIEIPNSVTSIGEGAFLACSSLTSIEIPNSVTSIGDGAFVLCSSLTSIEIPNGVTSIGDYTFCYCSSLTSIEIPDSVTSIGNNAFAVCSSLTRVTIPDSVTSIGIGAFDECSSLNEIVVSDTNNNYSSIDGVLYNKDKTELIRYPEEKKGQFVITDGVTSIGDYAFSFCSSLTSIEIPNSVTSIGYGAFYGCDSLTDVYYGGTEDEWKTIVIGFYNESLTDANIHFTENNIIASGECGKDGDNLTWTLDENGVLTISGNGEMADYNIFTNVRPWDDYKNRIISVTIQNGVTSIGESAFFAYNSLKSIEIPNSVTSIGAVAFCDCFGLTSIEIPNRVTNIGLEAFQHCSLTTLTIPDSVTSIGLGAFSCGNLEEIIVSDNNKFYSSLDGVLYNKEKTEIVIYPGGRKGQCVIAENVTSIGDYAFGLCTGLTSITIPESVTNIGYEAFVYCRGLTSLEIPNSVTNIGDRVFSGCSSLTSVTIPDSVTSIGDYAFHGCDSLTDVYYLGTQEEWNKIEIGNYNAPLLNAVLHAIETEPSITPSITVTENDATAVIDSAHVDALVSADTETVHIDVTDTTAENVTVTIPANSVDTIANNNKPVQIDTPAANLTIPSETMQSIQTQTNDELSISISPADIPDTLPPGIVKNSLVGAISIQVNNGDITTFEGKTLTIDIPVDDGFKVNRTYKVLVISADGSSELLNGKCIQGDGKYVQVTTTHLSLFIPSSEELPEDVEYSATLCLRDNIDVNFYVKNVSGDLSDYVVEATFKGVTQTTNLSDTVYDSGKNGYRVIVASATSKEMGIPVQIRVLYQNVEMMNTTYSVAQYCYNQLNPSRTDENLKKLCLAVLDYGAMAQRFFGSDYAPVNAPYAEGETERLNVTVPEKKASVTGAVTGLSVTGASLLLESEITINVRFRPDEGIKLNDYSFLVDNQPATASVEKDGRWLVKVAGIKSNKLNDDHTVTVMKNGTDESLAVTYSVMVYAYNKSTDSAVGSLAKALYNYAILAKTYFG